MTLTQAQLEARRGKLTASRVSVLMTGDAVGIMNLYREMIGDPTFEPEDLSRVWPVQLGSATEELNLTWFEAYHGRLSRRGEVAIHPYIPWAAATLDAWCDDLECPVETKHCGGREPLEVIIERYSPQTSWQMFVTGADQCALSVIMGAQEPIVEFLERDRAYIDEMVARGKQFMSFVERREPPVVLPAVPAPIMAERIVEMDGDDWKRAAEQWKQTFGAAQSAKEAEKILKHLVPPDAAKAFGYGVRITRDRAGRLSLRELTS